MARVTYELSGRVAAVRMDDGKVNVMSIAMQRELHEALDRATADQAVVVLSGRERVFSAGFDLDALSEGGPSAEAMLRGGFELAARLLSFPFPVVMACAGHAVAMGSFLLLAGDHRIGVTGPTRITANEVAIGLTLPHAAIAILRGRLTPAGLNRAAVLAETFTGDSAIAAGFLDQIVAPGDLDQTARAIAETFTNLDMAAHAATKLRVRDGLLSELRTAIDAEFPLT